MVTSEELEGNILTIMIKDTRAGKAFRLHTTHTIFPTVEGTCECLA